MANATPSPYSDLTATVKTAMDDLDAMEDPSAAAAALEPRREAEELLSLPDGSVQVFFVSAAGKVSTFSSPSSLRLYRFKEKEGHEEWVPVFIQAGGWTHPLIPGASPVLEAANGALMFPDVYAEEAGSSVGVVLAEAVPQEARQALHALLEEHTLLKTESPLPPEQQLGAVGRALVTGAEYLCKGMDLGAQKAATLIEYVGEREKAKTEAATEDVKMGAAWRYSAKGAKVATKATVKVSGFVANRVGQLTKATANYLASKVDKPVTGAVVGVTGGAKTTTKSASMHSLVDAARGGLVAFGTVYTGLESNAKVLGGSLKDNSVNVVQHRYGGEAAKVYSDGMTAAGNAAMTYMNVSSLGVKGIAKRTAKDTAKAVGKNVLEAHVAEKKAKTDGDGNGAQS